MTESLPPAADPGADAVAADAVAAGDRDRPDTGPGTAIDDAAAERFVRHVVGTYAHGLRSYLSRLERDGQDVEELLADVVYLAHTRHAELAALPEGQLRAWLYRAARLLGANRSRAKWRQRRMVERLSRIAAVPADDALAAVDDQIDRDLDRAFLTAVMGELRPDHREVLVLDALGRSGPEIGAQLDITPVAARKRLMHARLSFRATWQRLASQPTVAGSATPSSPDGTPPSTDGSRS